MKVDDFLSAEDKKIGVMVSGGMDSGLLLYLIANEKLTKNYDVDIIAYSIDRKIADERRHSLRMIEEIERQSGVPIRKKDVAGGDSEPDVQVIFGMIDAADQEKKTDTPLEKLFLATTAVPECLKEVNGTPTRNPEEHWLVIQPWGLNTKDQVIEIIKDQQLFWIIEQSHSCTRLSKGHCGICYNCIERKWALSSNDLLDLSNY